MHVQVPYMYLLLVYYTLYTLIFTCILVCRWPHKLRTGCAGHREACVHRSGSYHTPGGSYESVVCVWGEGYV